MSIFLVINTWPHKPQRKKSPKWKKYKKIKKMVIWCVRHNVFEAIYNYLLFQIVFLMKNRKSKKRAQEESPYSKPMATSMASRFNIKFELTRSNLSCFIGQKKGNKKTLPKRSQSNNMRRPSEKKKPLVTNNEQQVQQKVTSKKRLDKSPDIVREASNSILSQIQQRGIKCQWKEQQTDKVQHLHLQQTNDNQQIWSVFSVSSSIQKSYASTMDNQQPLYYHSMDYATDPYPTFPSKQNSFSYDSFEVRVDIIGYDPRTTIMIRNIPNKYTIKDLSQEIDFYFENTYDFLYLPCDFKNNCNVGYGFINFISTTYLRDFYVEFHNKRWGKFKSEKICILTYARLQGLNSLIEHFENSKVLNSKDKKYRPIIKPNAKINNLIRTQQQQ